jgi:ABC-2 type transport system permease protein
MFFMSSALYPLWKLREAGAELLYRIAILNPFTHAVELIRYAAYGKFNAVATVVVLGFGAFAFAMAARGYDPNKGAIGRIRRD